MQNRVAAIWARVSTSGQGELSLDSQVSRTRAKLEAEGYFVPPERVLRVDWPSLELSACPPFQTLKKWIERKEIVALGTLDRDRLNAKGIERLAFLQMCRDFEVNVILVQGPPLLDALEGQIVELALAVGKQRQVERAQQGSRNGLFDKLRIKRKPSFCHRVRGYNWDGDHRLVANTDYWQVELACHRALEGIPTRQIKRELASQGVTISVQSIYGWLINPIYAGRYHGHQKQAVEPRHRKAGSRGKSSIVRRPFEEWYYVPEVEVLEPPLTWDEYLAIQDRLHQNKLLASRNAKFPYLLRGRIFCDYHQRRYCGRRPHPKGWVYYCPVGKDCPRPYLNGSRIELEVRNYCQELLTSTRILDSELSRHRQSKGLLERELQDQLKSLQRRLNRCLNEETELERRSLRGLEDPKVYERLKSSYRAERQWCRERIEEIQAQIENLHHEKAVIASLQQIQRRLSTKLANASESEWREILTVLDIAIHVRETGDVQIEAGIPLRSTEEIVLSSPEPD